MKVKVIGGGFAGCEACYQLLKRGVDVTLVEMKPTKFSPAHHLQTLCEVVCSNSFKSDDVNTSSGLLKAEMRLLDSLVVQEHFPQELAFAQPLAQQDYLTGAFPL